MAITNFITSRTLYSFCTNGSLYIYTLINRELDGRASQNDIKELNKFFESSNVSLEHISESVEKELLNHGINPAGPYPSKATFAHKNRVEKWSEAVDWVALKYKRTDEQLAQFADSTMEKVSIEILPSLTSLSL